MLVNDLHYSPLILTAELFWLLHSSFPTSSTKYHDLDQSSFLSSRAFRIFSGKEKRSYFGTTFLNYYSIISVVPSLTGLEKSSHDLSPCLSDCVRTPTCDVPTVHEEFEIVPWRSRRGTFVDAVAEPESRTCDNVSNAIGGWGVLHIPDTEGM